MDIKAILLIAYVVIGFIGGLTAYKKKDYFSRGLGICLITSIFGLVGMFLAPDSNVKNGNVEDKHNWPHNLHVVLTTIFVLLILSAIILSFMYEPAAEI